MLIFLYGIKYTLPEIVIFAPVRILIIDDDVRKNIDFDVQGLLESYSIRAGLNSCTIWFRV